MFRQFQNLLAFLLNFQRKDLFVFSSDLYQDNGTTSFVDSSNVPRDNKRKVATLQVRRNGLNMVFDWETIRISELRRDSAHTPDLERVTIGSFYDPAKTISHYVVIIKANEIQINRFGMNGTQFKTLAEDTDYDFLGSSVIEAGLNNREKNRMEKFQFQKVFI